MISVLMLSSYDTLRPDDWVRPIVEAVADYPGQAPALNSFSPYSGCPQNHLKWVQARDVLGDCWMGKTMAELDQAWEKIGGFPYEVIRGTPPQRHIWDWRAERVELFGTAP